MAANTFVVDRTLGAVPVSRLLDIRAQLRVAGAIDKLTVVSGDRPIVTGDQTLQPNVIFPSEKSAGVGYYLPLYRVSTDADGQPAVELRFKPGPDGEVGRLTITLTWTAPRPDARAMDVIVTPTLRYRVPVQGGTGAAGWERTTALQPFSSAGPLLVRSTTIFTDKGLFDSVYQAISQQAQHTTLDLLIRARVGVKTWRQVVVGQPTWTDQNKVLVKRGALFTDTIVRDHRGEIRKMPAAGAMKIRMAAPAPATPVAAPIVTPLILRHAAVTPRVAVAAAPAARLAVSPAVLAAARMPATPAAPAATPVRTLGKRRLANPATNRAVLAHAYTPKLKDAVIASDLKIAGRKAVPVNVVLNPERQPAVVDADLDNTQSMPFTFDPSVHRGVFIEGYNTGIHLLVPLTLVGPDNSTHVVYRDSLMRDVIHVPPSGFRLERERVAPFLPALSFLASDFSTTDNDDEADVLFRVVANYRLEPWLNPDIVELARAELAKENLIAHFTTGTAHDAKLSLDLDLLGDAQVRPAATVDPATGINDALEMDHQTFVRIWRERLATSGVNGWVEYQLFDGSPARVPVELSLREQSAELFDVTFVGPVQDHPSRYRVTIRNRVESPARITRLPAELIAGGGIARAVAPESILNQVLQPQEMRQLDYDATGVTGDVADFSPTVIGQVEPNLSALLRLLMVSHGYASLGFSVTVRAADGSFGPPAAGNDPLTGLLVEFDDGTRVTLTPSDDEADVTVVGRLIDQSLGTADDSQRYFYRVTNLHASGEGARTSWMEKHGSDTLEVSSAIVRLDF